MKNKKIDSKSNTDNIQLNEEHQSIIKTYESLLKSYQRWVLVMFYPALFSAVAACFAFKSSNFSRSFLLGHQLVLSKYFQLHPLGGNVNDQQNIYGYLIVLCVAIVYCVINGYLVSRSYNQKRYPMIIMTCLYGLDLVVSCLDIVLEPQATFNMGTYVGNIVVHVIFLLLFIVPFLKYGKLSSFNKKIKGE